MNTEQVLTRLNIDAHSAVLAVQQVRAIIEGSENPLGAAKVLFNNLTVDADFTFTDANEARLTVACLVNDAIKLGEQYDPNQALKRAAEWIVRHRQNNPWAFVKGGTSSSVVATETIERQGVAVEVKQDGKLKKGGKQVLAKALFEQNPEMPNKDLIQLFMKELDMSIAGARTYVYNLRKTPKQ